VTAGVNKPRPGPAAAAGRGQAFRQKIKKRIRKKVESQESKNELPKCFPNKREREAQQLLFFSFAIA
jgi:hypothetical protein